MIDPNGTCGQDTNTSVFVCVDPPPPFGGGSNDSSHSYNPNTEARWDQPRPLNIPELYNVALGLLRGVQTTPGYTNCDALADFATAAAMNNASKGQVDRAFGVLTPSQFASNVSGVSTVSNSVFLYSGGGNRFLSQYQNTPSDSPAGNGDQGHHFAAFFQLGVLYGANAGVLLSNIFEQVEAAIGNGHIAVNQGDINLGIAAAQLGADLANNKFVPSELGARISATICQH